MANATVIVERSKTVVVTRDAPQATTVVAPPPAVRTVDKPATAIDTMTIIQQGPRGPAGAPGGTSTSYIADGDLGGHRIVRATAAGAVGYADAGIEAHGDDIIGLTLGAADDGEAVEVQRVGAVEFNGWSWTPGDPVFLGAAGTLTQSPAPADAFVKVVGFATSPTELFLQLEPSVYL